MSGILDQSGGSVDPSSIAQKRIKIGEYMGFAANCQGEIREISINSPLVSPRLVTEHGQIVQYRAEESGAIDLIDVSTIWVDDPEMHELCSIREPLAKSREHSAEILCSEFLAHAASNHCVFSDITQTFDSSCPLLGNGCDMLTW